MTIQILSVTGMTCTHCVEAVTGELRSVDGVRTVKVDLASGEVRVGTERPVDPEDLRAAVEEAGHALAGRGTR